MWLEESSDEHFIEWLLAELPFFENTTSIDEVDEEREEPQLAGPLMTDEGGEAEPAEEEAEPEQRDTAEERTQPDVAEDQQELVLDRADREAEEAATAASEETAEDTDGETAGQALDAEVAVEGRAEPFSEIVEAEDSEAANEDELALQAWRTGVSADAAAVPRPELSEARNGGGRIRSTGIAMRDARRPARAAVNTQARAAVSAPPEVENARPAPPPDPVPRATELVDGKSDVALDEQQMPDLNRSPRGTQPRSGERPLPASETERLTAGEPAVDQQEMQAGQETESGEQEHAENVRETSQEQAPDEQRRVSSEGVTLQDEPREEPEPLPPAARSVITSVLARLLANPEAGAEQILSDARAAAYNGVLAQEYPEIGSDELASITESLTSKLHGVAEEAGVAQEELDDAISERNDELRAQREAAEGDVENSSQEERTELENAAQEENDEVAGAREQVDAHTQQQYEAGGGRADPELINRRKTAQQQRLNRKVGRQRTGYTRAKDRRVALIRAAASAQVQAYRATVQRDERAIRSENEGEESLPLSAQWEIAGVHTWGAGEEQELSTRVRKMIQEVEENATTLRSEISDAGSEAHELVEDWANEELDVQQSWWDRLLASFSSWFSQAQAETEAWEEVRAGETRDSMLGNYIQLNQFVEQQGDLVDLESNEAFNQLGEEQQAVMRAYYSDGPDARNPIAAVAAGLKVRMSTQLRPGLLEKFEEELQDKPDSEWEKLDALGRAQGGGFSADRLRGELRQAMFGGVTGWGTDEDRIFAALGGLTPIQSLALRKCYSATHDGASLESDLESELSDAELTRASAQLEGDQALADAAILYEAMDGWGTDEEIIMRTLRGKSEEERAAIIEAYEREYGEDLSDELDSELSDHDLDRADALMEGDTALADAIAIDQAMHGGWTGAGTDEAAIEAIYEDVRRDVAAEAQRQGWSTEEMEAEVRRRNAGIEGSYQDRYGGEWEPGDESALRQAFRSDLSGSELDLVVALADNDLIAADAARLDIESRSIIPDEDVTNGVLRHQYERAYEELRRDEWPAMQRELDRQAEENGWDRYQRREAERRMERDLERRAQERSRGYMSDLETRFDSEYTRWSGAGLSRVLDMTMSPTDRQQARDLMDQGGRLSPAQEIHYAVTGAGTDEQAIQRALAGRSPEEIADIRAEWNRLHPNESLDDRLGSELGGRDEFDTNMLLQGEPRNAAEEIAQMRERANWEFDNASGLFSGEEEGILRDRLERMEQSYATLTDPDATPEERATAARRFEHRSSNVSSAISVYREQMDAATDALATAAAVAAAIVVVVVAAVLTPFTGGGSAAAGAGILAALGGALTSGTVAAAAAVAAATATIVTKQAMLGDAYSGEDMAVDAVVGVVDAVTAYATAGIGTGLLKAARGGMLAKMAVSPSRVTRIAAHGLAEGAEGLISSLPAAVTGNLANDKNWEQGNPLTNIVTGIAVEAGIGTVVSAGMGSLGGIRRAPTPDARPSGDLLAHRGTPRERLAQWRAYKAEHPDADMRTWLREFDEGVSQRLARGEAADRLQREMRTELLSGIPPAQRRQFSNCTVEVLSDAEFTRRTGNSNAQAVTLVEGGKPRVVIREGAHPSVLREEGLHMLQSVDPRTRRAFRSLDESKLARWHDLSIDEQLRLYRNKVTLEIDAQSRLMTSLDDDLASAGSDAGGRRALQAQRDVAEQNLRNLRGRLGDVDDISPAQRRSIAQGLEGRPRFLRKEPPRLFSKGEIADTRRALYEALGSGKNFEAARSTLRRLGDRVRGDDAVRKTYHKVIEVAERLSRSNPRLARNYLDAVDEVLSASPRRAGTKQVVEFIDAAANLPHPQRFLRHVRDVLTDGRIRGEQLTKIGRKLKTVKRTDRVDFMRRLRNAMAVDPTNEAAVARAFNRLRKFAKGRRGLPSLVEKIAAEVNRKGTVDWGTFRTSQGIKFKDKTAFTQLETIIKARQKAGWTPSDIGPIRRWAEVLQSLHDDLPNVAEKRALMRDFEQLLEGFDSGYKRGQYRKFRHRIRDRILDHVMGAGGSPKLTSKREIKLLRRFLAEIQDVDPASKGALFGEYRRRLLDAGGTRAGQFSKVTNLPKGAGVTLPNNRMADGRIMVHSKMSSNGPMPGKYLVEDKAGGDAFKLDQARDYSDLLDNDNLTTDASNRGIIYIFENPDAALAARNDLNDNLLNPNIFVATLDKKTGRLTIIDR
jgi:hypothetical protein